MARVKRALSEATKERKPEWHATAKSPGTLRSLLNELRGVRTEGGLSVCDHTYRRFERTHSIERIRVEIRDP